MLHLDRYAYFIIIRATPSDRRKIQGSVDFILSGNIYAHMCFKKTTAENGSNWKKMCYFGAYRPSTVTGSHVR